MVRLIDDLLDVSRISTGKIRLRRAHVSLSGMIDTAVEANRAALTARNTALDIDLPAEPVSLDVDPTRFVQIVSNLLHNAIKFTEPGGRVRIAAAVHAEARELVLTVTDSGVGIAAEVLPRVFDLFTQGVSSSGGAQAGLGIGLALARRLVEMHGGTIEAASDGSGRGSTFTIRFTGAVVASSSPSPEAPPRAREVARRVMVIDDNRDAADLTAMLVSELGGESAVAYDGESGLAVVERFHPDIVLLDLGMPGIDGYETCRRIRRRYGPELRVIAVTGWAQEQDKNRAMLAGFDAHMTKPIDPATLGQLLSRP
jgi:CheY-like chemotaxis protein